MSGNFNLVRILIDLHWRTNQRVLCFLRRLTQTSTSSSSSSSFSTHHLACPPSFTAANPSPGCSLASLLRLGRTFSYIRNALSPPQQASLEADIAAMLADQGVVGATAGSDGGGPGTFELPWECKAYFLRPVY